MGQNHTALIAEMRTEIANLKKRTAEQAFGAFQSGLPVCANCGKSGHTIKECFRPGGGLAHYTQQQVHEYLANKRKQREQQQQQQQQPKETADAAVDERDEQIKALTEKVQLRESQKHAERQVQNYGVAIELGYAT